ncbi:MAG: phosphocholine cytidylyltransferase family protein [Polyangiaceae bacterium]
MLRGVVASGVPMSNSTPVRTDAAVILVAGVGSRLRPLTNDRPKALMDVGGETILGRAIRLLVGHGVQEIVLATGYREDQIRAAVRFLDAPISYFRNDAYESTQNSVSLGLCSTALRGKSFFKLDGDVVFQADVLTRLTEHRADLCVAVDSKRALDAEAMKVRAEDGVISAFGKEIPVASAHAETIGIERLSSGAGERVLTRINSAVAAGSRDQYYEHFYSELVAARAISAAAVEVGDLAWSEVDTFEDLARARAAVALKSAGAA